MTEPTRSPAAPPGRGGKEGKDRGGSDDRGRGRDREQGKDRATKDREHEGMQFATGPLLRSIGPRISYVIEKVAFDMHIACPSFL